jgi:hypothetical protein
MTTVTAVLINGAGIAAPGAQRSVINTISMRFDANVEGHVGTDDRALWNLSTSQAADRAPPVAVTYDRPTNTATWTFPAASIPNGNYRAMLKSLTVVDGLGNPLDGDRDGVGGDADVDARDQVQFRLNLGRRLRPFAGDRQLRPAPARNPRETHADWGACAAPVAP